MNGRFCAKSKNLLWPPFLNKIFLFKLYFKNVHAFMFFNFEPFFFLLKNTFGKVVFQILARWLFFAKRKFFYWPPFWNESFLIVLFAGILLFWMYTHGASFVPKFLRKSTHNSMGPSGPPCAQTGVKKYIMHLRVKTFLIKMQLQNKTTHLELLLSQCCFLMELIFWKIIHLITLSTSVHFCWEFSFKMHCTR